MVDWNGKFDIFGMTLTQFWFTQHMTDLKFSIDIDKENCRYFKNIHSSRAHMAGIGKYMYMRGWWGYACKYQYPLDMIQNCAYCKNQIRQIRLWYKHDSPTLWQEPSFCTEQTMSGWVLDLMILYPHSAMRAKGWHQWIWRSVTTNPWKSDIIYIKQRAGSPGQGWYQGKC